MIPVFSSPHPGLQQVTSWSVLMHPFMFVRLLPSEDHVCLVYKSFNSDLLQIEIPGFRMFSDFKVLDNAGSICRICDLLHVISIFHTVAGEECICNQMKLKSNDNQPHHQMELLFCLSCWRCWSCGTELTGIVGLLTVFIVNEIENSLFLFLVMQD